MNFFEYLRAANHLFLCSPMSCFCYNAQKAFRSCCAAKGSTKVMDGLWPRATQTDYILRTHSIGNYSGVPRIKLRRLPEWLRNKLHSRVAYRH